MSEICHSAGVALAAALSLLSGLVALAPGTAYAQTEGAADVDLVLVSQPVWHASEDRLDIRLRIHNRGAEALDGFRVQLGVFDRTQTRTALHESFAGLDPLLATSSFARAFDRRVVPGGSTTVTVDDPIESSLVSLAQATEGGVYPLSITLLGPDLQFLDGVNTSLILFPTAPENRLGILPVIVLNGAADRDADGLFRSDGDTLPLADAVTDGGWLDGMLESLLLEAAPPGPAGRRTAGNPGAAPLHATIAPTPRLVEELADMSDGYRRAQGDDVVAVSPRDPSAGAARNALGQLSSLLALTGVHEALVPYAFADLPALSRHLSPETAIEHIGLGLSQGAAALEGALRRDIDDDWILVPGGRLDLETLERLQGATPAGELRTFFSDGSLEPPPDPGAAGCPAPFGTFACPVATETAVGEVMGWQSDPGLQERVARLVRSGDNPLDLQRLFAETAMIWAEVPAMPDRMVPVVFPAEFHPTPALAQDLFRGLARAPWIETRTATEGLATGLSPENKRVVDDLPSSPNDPGPGYFAEIESAEAVVDSFASVGPPPEMRQRLIRNLLVAESRTWWEDFDLLARGRAFARDSLAEAEAEFVEIGVIGPDEITLTSRRGSVQFLVRNDTGYPVKLDVDLQSTKLRFDASQIPEEFPPETTPLQVSVTAEASGIFPIEVELRTPNGDPIEPNGAKNISVRSTELNQIALAITIGALAFLVLFYVYRGVRRRRGPDKDVAGAQPS